MADPARSRATDSLKGLRTRIRASRVLDSELKRRWLEILPNLSQAELTRLSEILTQETAAREES